MKLTEITNLISIRDYLANSLNNSSVDRKVVHDLSKMLILVDNKIISAIQEEEFKKYIGYANVQEAVAKVAEIRNIKSGLK